MMESSQLIIIGIIVIFIGMFMVFFGSIAGMQKGESKVAVGGFIGFIPFGFANDKRMLWVVVGISLAFMVFWIVMQLLFNKP